MRFVRDLDHNYMVFQAPATERTSYKLKMLSANRAEGLLPFGVRNVNGVRYLYYEIDRMQSLENYFGSSKMGSEELSRLLRDLRAVREELRDLLIGEESLLLSVKTVFTPPGAERFFFACAPVAVGDEDCGCYTFFEGLTELVDPADTFACDLVYSLCDRAGDETLTVMDVLAMTPGVPGNGRDTEAKPSPAPSPVYERVSAETVYGKEDDPLFAEADGYLYKEREAERPRDDRKEGEKRGRGLSLFLLPLLFFLVLLADLYVRSQYHLSGKEYLLSVAVAVVCVISGAGTLLGALRNYWSLNGDGDKTYEDDDEDIFEGDGLYHAEEEEEEEFEPVMPPPKDAPFAIPKHLRAEPPSPTVSLRNEAASGAGETRLLNDGAPKRRPRLYGRGNEQNVHIPLEKLPLTLGKLAGCADILLTDDTVSRLHARIEEARDKGVSIRDLNSTNGTYINGVRLQPNEEKALRIGDEVCLGNMVFDYL